VNKVWLSVSSTNCDRRTRFTTTVWRKQETRLTRENTNSEVWK